MRATPLSKLAFQARVRHHGSAMRPLYLNLLAHECGGHVFQGWRFGRNLHIDCLTNTRCIPPQACNFILQQGVLQLHTESNLIFPYIVILESMCGIKYVGDNMYEICTLQNLEVHHDKRDIW